MSCKETKIQVVCGCLSVLTTEIRIDPADSKRPNSPKDTFTRELRRNVHHTFQKLENYPEMKAFVAEYIQPCFEDKCTSCDYLKFLQLCLILLRLLKFALKEEHEICTKKADVLMKFAQKEDVEGKRTLKVPLPVAKLSISQKKILQKCLQFAVSLGILPNLLRGIGIPLSKRLRHAIILEHFTSESTLYQKHIQIALCLDTLLGCMECEPMQNVIMVYHGTDILAGLLQLCHGPIKKIDKTEGVSSEPLRGKICFKLMLAAIKDNSKHSDAQIIHMMLTHRKYFVPLLESFLKLMCPSLLMWELLLFQGIHMKPDETDPSITKSPLWLRKICNQLLTDMVLQSHGIADLVQVVLDKAHDADIRSGKVDSVRIEAVARLITYNPVRHMSVRDYVKRLSSQVFHLLHHKGSQLDGLLKYIASCIILQFCERDIKSAEEHLLVNLLKPLWSCVRRPANSQRNSGVVVKEVELTTCIEDLHQIFATSVNPLSRKYIKLLYPFSHCLCNMFFFLLRGKSNVKSKVKNLIHNILRSATDEEALSLLHGISFSNNKLSGMYITKVSFANGEEGGIAAIPKIEEEFPDEIIRYHAILDILSELQNKDLNRSYILLVLKEFCSFHLESKEHIMDPENIKAGILFNALLQELSEWNVDIGEALMSNISEVIEILMTLLESICNCSTDATFYEKTLWVVLMILNSILESDDQLTIADWNALKQCLPSLKMLQQSDIDMDLKEIIFSIIIHIATDGAACKNGGEVDKNMVDPDDPNSILNNEQSLLELVEQFERQCSLSSQSIRSRSPLMVASSESCSSSSSNTQSEKDVPKHSEDSSDNSSESPRTPKPGEFVSRKLETGYVASMRDIKANLVHIKGHGVIALLKLLKTRDEEALENRHEVMKTLRKSLEDEDSYVFLPSIGGLAELAKIDSDLVVPYVLNQYAASEEKHIILKLGEVVLKIFDSLGDMLYKYQDMLLHSCLVGTKRDDPQIRSSSLSNLGQACMCLKFNISGHWLQEILICVMSFLKTDPDIEVRRCAVMVIYLLLKGVGKNMLEMLDKEIKTIYTQLKIVYNGETDDVLRQHSQLALEEINAILKDMFTPEPSSLTKEIRILQ
ncbi:transport and Golgi organization protein 6 homolog [Trichonephila inaurata madagascariensis]|uniref:Transport and Golgi organization protein 6 homolog n=1 Tax=Trichonephila inaurata madagascariensis TaxID=2747483 RepID=A0A8X6WVU2_9ARAC|nr:transport and Golgi organization protein 6 homolog [Trichonephila inaurata madagascariensis]